eukprot:7269334-Lingulodinium_polyedra.AAC.1
MAYNNATRAAPAPSRRCERLLPPAPRARPGWDTLQKQMDVPMLWSQMDLAIRRIAPRLLHLPQAVGYPAACLIGGAGA